MSQHNQNHMPQVGESLRPAPDLEPVLVDRLEEILRAAQNVQQSKAHSEPGDTSSGLAA